MPGPATILFLSANPSDTTQLALTREFREIDQRLVGSKHRDAFELKQAWAVRATDLQACLLRHQPAIVHFSGHGNPAGALLFADEADTSTPVRAESAPHYSSGSYLAVLVAGRGSTLRAEAMRSTPQRQRRHAPRAPRPTPAQH